VAHPRGTGGRIITADLGSAFTPLRGKKRHWEGGSPTLEGRVIETKRRKNNNLLLRLGKVENSRRILGELGESRV